jgi:homoserine kinase
MQTEPVQRSTQVGRDIIVPASISNLGPGFDALSVAVQVYLRARIVEVRASEPDTIAWEFAGTGPTGENRLESAYRLARAHVGRPAPGLRVQVSSDIPQAAGLGSSAAATIAGLRIYEAVTAPRPLEDWLRMATELEGHPDNAAAALLGGIAVSCQLGDGRIIARSSRWPEAVRLIVATPEMGLHTSHARDVLPRTVPLADAIFNLQRALLFVHALRSGRYDDLREAMKDRWHQPARASLVPGLDEAIAFDDPAVLGVCLSGAGPSIVALATDGAAQAASLLDAMYKRLGLPCTIRTLSAHQPGFLDPIDVNDSNIRT